MSDQSQNTDRQSSPRWLNTLTGSKICIRTSGSETDSRLCVIEYIEPPNSAPPVFTRHEFIEVFCVVKGVLTFQFADEHPVQLTEGQSVTCPPWKPHSFWNESDESVTALLVCTPSGLDEFFIKSDQLLRGAHDIDESDLAASMKTLRTQYGLEHTGNPPQRIGVPDC